MGDLLEYLSKYRDEAERTKDFYVIGIASPTGFDSKAKEYIFSDDFKKNFLDLYLSVCLIDLLSGELIYNKLDDRIKDYVDVFEPELEAEKVSRAKELIKQKLLLTEAVTLTSVVQESKLSELIVKKAFYELEREKVGKIYKVKDEVVLKRI